MRKKLPFRYLYQIISLKKFAGVTLPGILIFNLFFFQVHGQNVPVQLLKDLNTEISENHNHKKLLTHGGGLIYYVDDNTLYSSNGTAEGTIYLYGFESIKNLTMSGNTLFFTGYDKYSGPELWRSNGRHNGSYPVKDIVPGLEGSFPEHLTNVNGTLFFVANTPENGKELWKTDGSPKGTMMVKDIIRGKGSSNPAHLTNVNGTLYFVANDGAHGYEVWKSDGTSEGTTLLKDIRNEPRLSSHPSSLHNINGTLFFSASNGISGSELWKSDGTTSGTLFVKDIRPGSSGSGIENMIDVNGTLFFTAHDGVHGDELWKSNGTEAGTVLVKDMSPGSNGSNNKDVFLLPMGQFTNINGILYFIASKNTEDFIYRSDGTETGTFIIQPAYGIGINPPRPAFTLLNGDVYFFNATDRESTGAQYNLWRMSYSGTEPVPVKEFAGGDNFYNEYFQEMINFNDALYTFGRLKPESGYAGGFKLIRSDGTSDGTVVIKDLSAPSLSSNPAEMVKVNGLIYIRTEPEYSENGSRGELYSTNGTKAGTIKLADMREGNEMVPVGNKLFFTATAGYGWGFYVTQGTPETTILLDGSVDGNVPHSLTNVNGLLYYHNDDGQLWRTDGITRVLIRDLNKIISITNVNGQAHVLVEPSDQGLELWRTNGSGTLIRVKIIRTGYADPPKFQLATNIGRFFYFLANDGVHGYEIWRSDGTAYGTFMMFNLNTQDESLYYLEPEDDIRALTVYNNKLFFSAKNDHNVWGWYYASNNTTFERLIDLPPVTYSLVHNGEMYLFPGSTDDNPYVELWVSGGSASGTRWLSDVEGRGPVDHAILNNILYFNTKEGKLIMRSDGSNCGTFTITPKEAATLYAYPLESLGNNMIVGATNPYTGMEPYIYVNIRSVVNQDGCNEPTISTYSNMLQEDHNNEIFTSYPNPFANEFTLRITGDENSRARVALYTASGFPVETIKEIDTNTDYPNFGITWPKGVYVVKVYSGGKLTTHRVVKR